MEDLEQIGRLGDFKDAAEKTFIWSGCREDLIAGIVKRTGEIDNTWYLVTVVLEVDVLIPHDAWPVISWHTSTRLEHECVISMGIDHWEFISRGGSSFVRTTMNSVKARMRADATIGTVAVKERTSNVVWKFNVMTRTKDDIVASYPISASRVREAYLGTGEELNVHPLRGDGPRDEDNLGGTMPGLEDVE